MKARLTQFNSPLKQISLNEIIEKWDFFSSHWKIRRKKWDWIRLRKKHLRKDEKKFIFPRLEETWRCVWCDDQRAIYWMEFGKESFSLIFNYGILECFVANSLCIIRLTQIGFRSSTKIMFEFEKEREVSVHQQQTNINCYFHP